MMKRAAIFLLVLSLLAGIALTAEAAGTYTLPEALKTVPKTTDGLHLPEELPPYVLVKVFTLDDDGSIHLELGSPVPRLKIMEQNILDGVESTIYTKKNASTADAHMVGKENSVFTVRMIWKLGEMDYVRDYSTWSGNLTFAGCTATETLKDTAGYEPFTSVTRTLTFNETAKPVGETWTLENEKDRFTRTVTFNGEGRLKSAKQTWESVKIGEYQFVLETDRDGNVTAITAQDKRNSFYAKSIRLDESPDGPLMLSVETLDSSSFDEQLARKYPQLARGLIDYEAAEDEIDPEFLAMFNTDYTGLLDPEATPEPSTMTDLTATMTDLAATETDLPEIRDEDLIPIPANARIWALNFGDYMESSVYAFIATDPVLILKDGRAALNPEAKDVNGDPIKLKKNKVTSPVMEAAVYSD